VPFGVSTGSTVAAKFETQLTLTDPLPIAVFDAKEDHLLLGVKIGGFSAGAYVFNGATQHGRPGAVETRLEHYGATVGYGMQADPVVLVVGLSMIDSVFDTDGLQDKFPEALPSRAVPAIAAHVRLGLFGVSVVTAYYAALREAHFTKDDNAVRIQPAAWYVELGYTTDLLGQKTFAALSYSETEELASAFPKTRMIATAGRFLYSDKIRLHFDYAHDTDYKRTPSEFARLSGKGKTADSYILRLTYEW
jgi:hypothetical protein